MATCIVRQPVLAGCRATAGPRAGSRRRMQPVRAAGEVVKVRRGMLDELMHQGCSTCRLICCGRQCCRQRRVRASPLLAPHWQAVEQRKRPEYIPNRIDDPDYVRIFDTTLRDGEQSPGERQLLLPCRRHVKSWHCCLCCCFWRLTGSLGWQSGCTLHRLWEDDDQLSLFSSWAAATQPPAAVVSAMAVVAIKLANTMPACC
jgi:hypothetical protein